MNDFRLDANSHRDLQHNLRDADLSLDQKLGLIAGLLNRLEPALLQRATAWEDKEIAQDFLEFAAPTGKEKETREERFIAALVGAAEFRRLADSAAMRSPDPGRAGFGHSASSGYFRLKIGSSAGYIGVPTPGQDRGVRKTFRERNQRWNSGFRCPTLGKPAKWYPPSHSPWTRISSGSDNRQCVASLATPGVSGRADRRVHRHVNSISSVEASAICSSKNPPSSAPVTPAART